MTLKAAFVLFSFAVLGSYCQNEKEWWRTATFYQVYPRSFMDSIKHDGIGDIRGMKGELIS
jgi:hypothetical protein